MYLTNIYSWATATAHSKKLDINSLFNKTGSKTEADWVTDTLWMPVGKPVHFHSTDPLFNAETQIAINKGTITSIQLFNYYNPYEALYAKDVNEIKYEEALRTFVYNHIHWKQLPGLNNQTVKYLFTIETGKWGKAQIVKIPHQSNQHSFTDEAKRVIALLPMGLYYSHGKQVKDNLFLEIDFSEANRKKYAR